MKDKLLVSFNLVNIPRDMKITSVKFHLPLSGSAVSTNVYIKEITSRWSENGVKVGKVPTLSKTKKIVRLYPKQKELVINMTLAGKKWYSNYKTNHGIFVRVEKTDINYLKDNPPFLIIDTI
ncbi:MAG: DNRLRE domain-containing protein [Clostridiaceae bacterium]|nr:DNRLRE domain-containing protein [Clostridiaceae bacterium]